MDGIRAEIGKQVKLVVIYLELHDIVLDKFVF